MRLAPSLVAAMTLSSFALSQSTFTTGAFPSCPAPQAVAAGDLDGDGDNDLATAHPASNQVCANLNNGTGTAWANGVLFTYGAGSTPVELVVGQFDGLGRVDIATILQGTNQVVIHPAGGAWPAFGTPQFVTVGFGPIEAVAFDADLDGDSDLAVICQNPSTVWVLRNTGGVFAVANVISLSISPHSIGTSNFDLAGPPDLVVTGSAGLAYADVLINTTTGIPITFAAEQLFAVDARPFGVCTGDFNGDGYMDIATDNSAFSTVSVLLNDPTALSGTTVGFLRTDYPLAPGVISGPGTEIDCADFDCDGDVDLAATVNFSNRVALLWNSGTGTFSAPTFGAAPVNCGDLVAAEFTGDPWADIATANPTSNDVSVLRNDLAAGCCEHIFIGGIPDGFGSILPFGPEDACPDPAVLAWSGFPARNFDGPVACGQALVHRFSNLPGNIKSAQLRMRMRADCLASPNDRFALGWNPTGPNFVFTQSVAALTGSPWTAGSFGGVSLDLSALPGGTNLLPKLNADGLLDILIADDTAVDSMTLVIETCANSIVQMNLNVSPIVFGTTVTWTATGAPTPPPGFVVFLVGPAVGPGPAFPGGDLCLLAPSILSFVATSASGTASLSLPLPYSTFPPCVTLSNQAVGFDGTFTVVAHSNTWTSQFFD